MPFTRLLVLTTCLCALPAAAIAQTAASTAAPQAAPAPAAATQDVTVVDPDMNALTPAKPTSTGKPRWSDFPRTPKNVPTVYDFAGRVHKEEADKAALIAIGKGIVWDPFKPDAIAADANARIDPSKLVPIDPQLTTEQTEAYAQSLRDQVTPPPLAQ